MANTGVPLYRVGNLDAGLDRIRSKDVDVRSDRGEGEICVWMSDAAHTAGLSCWSVRSRAANTAFGRRVWELPAGSLFDDTMLRLWEPHAGSGHWYWSPTRNMRGSEFIAALRLVNARFQ